VDVLINNAGLQRPWKHPITTVSPFSWVGAETDEDQADLVEKLVWEGVGEYVHRI